MEHASHEDIKKHVKIYVAVFAALAVLTIVTVAVSYLRLPTFQAICLALAIASVKAALVILFFMHLISEKKVIFYILILTAVFLAAMFILIPLTGVWVPPQYVS